MEDKDVDIVLDQLDAFLGVQKKNPRATKRIRSATRIDEHLASEIKRLKMTCLQKSPECTSGDFKAGRCPYHYKLHEEKLGRERHLQGKQSIGDDGFVRTYDENGKWRLKHRIVMEQKLGRTLDRSEVVKFLDGDKTNCSPDNLILRTGEQLTVTCPCGCNHTFEINT